MKFRRTNAMSAVALLTGLAAGAVIGALFAPERGNDIRKLIAGKLKELAGFKVASNSLEIKDHSIEDKRVHDMEIAEQLTGGTKEIPDLSKTTLKQTGPKSRRLPVESV